MRVAAAWLLAAALWVPVWAAEGGDSSEVPPPPAADDGSEAPASERDLDAVIAEILSGDSVEDYDSSTDCIARSRISRTEILNERFVVFHLRGDEKYLVQFRRRCPGLRRNGAIRLETRSFRVCAMDTIQGFYEMGIGRGTWGASCLIPGFEPVTREQVAILKEELRRSR